MNFKNLFLLLACAGINSLYSQSLSHSNLVSGGDVFSSGGYELSYSFGEEEASLLNGNFLITIGFQQADLNIGTQITSNNEVSNPILVYPNPSNGVFYLTYPDSSYPTVFITNSMGEKTSISIDNGKIDLTSLSNGIYFLNIFYKENPFTYKLIKHD